MSADEEVEHEELPVRLGRYSKADVDRVLSKLLNDNARLKRDREELRARVVALEAQLDGFRKIEQALLDSVLTGQRAALDVIEEAEDEKRLILDSAREAAEGIVVGARNESARLVEEIERLRSLESELVHGYRAFLLAALNVLEAKGSASPQPEGAPVENGRPEETPNDETSPEETPPYETSPEDVPSAEPPRAETTEVFFSRAPDGGSPGPGIADLEGKAAGG